MTVLRRYTLTEVEELVELFRDDPDVSSEKFAGMKEVVQLLAHFEHMTDEDIEAEVRNNFRHVK